MAVYLLKNYFQKTKARQMAKAICRDRKDIFCGATQLGEILSPTLARTCMRRHLMTECPSPARIGEACPTIRSPSEAHSLLLSVPRSQHPRLSVTASEQLLPLPQRFINLAAL